MLSKKRGELHLDPVDGRDQEVPGAHCEVGDSEVEERVGGRSVVAGLDEPLHPSQMCVENLVESAVEEMFHRETLGEVRTRALAFPTPAPDVNLTGGHRRFGIRRRGNVGARGIHGQVGGSD